MPEDFSILMESPNYGLSSREACTGARPLQAMGEG